MVNLLLHTILLFSIFVSMADCFLAYGDFSDDGQWSSWSVFGRCSSSCGQGARLRTRKCQSRYRQRNREIEPNRNYICRGNSLQYFYCRQKNCEKGNISLREMLCKKKSTELTFGKHFDWVAGFKEIKNCDLVCDAMGKGFFHNFGAIQDGAFCELRSGKEGFCIKGNCMVVQSDGRYTAEKFNEKIKDSQFLKNAMKKNYKNKSSKTKLISFWNRLLTREKLFLKKFNRKHRFAPNCSKCKAKTLKRKTLCEYDFVISGKILSYKEKRFATEFSVRILRIHRNSAIDFKDKLFTVRRKRVNIKKRMGCDCRKLRIGKSYLLAGWKSNHRQGNTKYRVAYSKLQTQRTQSLIRHPLQCSSERK